MKQILQDMAKGGTTLAEAPAPQNSRSHVLIHTTTSLISAGTERMLVGFGKASYLDKARQQPDKVKMVLEKVATDGLMTTIEAVQSKLAQPLPLGYCNVGVVADVGAGVDGFQVGDRVVSNGPHADVVKVSKNLCARIPDVVDDESAAFVVVASIGLQGIRLAQPTLGEAFVVTGAGLIGLLRCSCCVHRAAAYWPLTSTKPNWLWRGSLALKRVTPAQGRTRWQQAWRSAAVRALTVWSSRPLQRLVIQSRRRRACAVNVGELCWWA